MSGFIPAGCRPLTEIRDEMGAERLGSALAAGDLAAYRLDPWGGMHELSPATWRAPNARQIIATGCVEHARQRAPEHGGGQRVDRFPVIVQQPRPTGRTPTPQARPPGTSPAWWPDKDVTMTEWVRQKRVVEAAEARIREGGQPITELRRDRELEAMWREAGRKVAEGTIGRVRRRERTK